MNLISKLDLKKEKEIEKKVTKKKSAKKPSSMKKVKF